MTTKVIDLPDIGEVLLEQSSKAKHINITVKPYKGIRVAVPKGVPFEKAEEIALAKSSWIKAKLEKMKQVEGQHQEQIQRPGFISRASAKGLITQRLSELADKHGISYNTVFIRNQKTRWGSCSAKKNISLNYKIVLLPPKLMDYVLLHELLHIKHGNHSRQFWDELNQLVGEDAKSLDLQLDEHRALLL